VSVENGISADSPPEHPRRTAFEPRSNYVHVPTKSFTNYPLLNPHLAGVCFGLFRARGSYQLNKPGKTTVKGSNAKANPLVLNKVV